MPLCFADDDASTHLHFAAIDFALRENALHKYEHELFALHRCRYDTSVGFASAKVRVRTKRFIDSVQFPSSKDSRLRQY